MDLLAAAGIPQDRMLGVLRRRSAIAIGLLLVCVVADLLAIAAEVGDNHLVSQLRSGAYVSFAAASTADNRVRDLGWVQIGLFVATAAAFIAWFSYAYANLERLGAAGLRFSKGWAIGGWFVPVLWFVRPKQIANDIWRGSDPDAPANLNLRSGGWSPSSILNWWWGAFVLAGVAGRIAFTSNRDATTPSAIGTSLKFLIASGVIDVFAALLAVVVVYETTARQRARIARLKGNEAVEPVSIRTWRIGAGGFLAIGVIVLAIVVGVAVAPSSATGTGSQTSVEAAKPARQVVADAVKAAQAASSFHVSGHVPASGTRTAVDVSFVRGKGATGSEAANGAKFDFVDIGNTAYLRSNSAFWKQVGVSGAVGRLFANRWLKIPGNNPQFGSFVRQYDARTFLNFLKSHGSVTSQGDTAYKGRTVVAIHDRAGDTLYVMASGTPYPVALVTGGDTLTFDRWNQPVTLTAPKGALDIARLGSG
jgi:hypothetical protein